MSDETDYRVALDIYRGPLDLLLYLIRENEVEITDIPIAKITDQFVQHLEVIQMIDPNAAGDFLVMASTLMEIKSRTLLPKPETGEEELDLDDPRIELIRQLMEYKRFKEAAAALADKEEEQALRFPRGLRQRFQGIGEEDKELDDVSIWDILSAFDKVMRETLRLQPATIVSRDIPLRQHIEALLRMLRVQGTVTFLNIFESCEDRIEAVGAFLAMLEMARRRILGVRQTGDRGEIYVSLVDEGPVAQLLEEVSEDTDLSAKDAPEGEQKPAVPSSVAQAADAIEPPLAPSHRTPPSTELADAVGEDGEPVSIDIRFDDEAEEIDEELKAIRNIDVREIDLGKEITHGEESEARHETPARAPVETTDAPLGESHPEAIDLDSVEPEEGAPASGEIAPDEPSETDERT